MDGEQAGVIERLSQINEGLRCMRDDLRKLAATIRDLGVLERRCEFGDIVTRLVQRGTLTAADVARLDADVEDTDA